MFYLQDKQNASINSYVLELILYLITKVLIKIDLITKVLIKIGLQELFSVFFSIYLTILSVGHKHGSFFANVAVYKINKFFQCRIIRKDFIVFSNL